MRSSLPILFTSLLLASFLLLALVQSTTCFAEEDKKAEVAPLELFNQRILPIFRSPNPSSCVQCHLSSVDLSNYILPSQEQTFASLRDQGLIDLDQPEKSKILTLIKMGEKDLDQGARLIHEKTRRAEYNAFASWIEACVSDPKLRDLPKLAAADLAKPDKPDAVIRHARKSRVLDSFVRNVWSQRMRCFPCHTPHEIDPNNPRHQAAIKTQKQFAEKYDSEMLARLQIFKQTPEATVRYLIERSRNTPQGQLPLINLAEPDKSLLLLKPLSKLPRKIGEKKFEKPTYQIPVSHMGGLKMHPDDQSYKSFISWLRDYANVVGGSYASVEDLPADNWFGSKLMLRLTAAPQAWKVGTPVQLFVYRWNEQDKAWTDEPVAFTQGTVTPRRIINGSLFLLGPKEIEKAAKLDREKVSLPRGKYLVKVYVDTGGQLAEDPTGMLGPTNFVGQAELKRARWREGFRQAEILSAALLKKE